MAGTRKLGRTSAHRSAMLRGMVTYLLENGSIETTVTRAKEVRSMTEKMITLGKEDTKIIGTSHACYAKCSYCNSGWGSKSSYHAS